MKRFLAIGVLVLCLMSSQIARADEKRDAKVKAEMVQNYLLWQEAWKLRDAERIISFQSPDFTTLFHDGVINKAKSEEGWRETMQSIRKVHNARVEIKKITLEPKRIIVWSTHHLDISDSPVPIGYGGTVKRTLATLQFHDIWVQYDHVWMLKRMEYIRAPLKTSKIIRWPVVSCKFKAKTRHMNAVLAVLERR